MPVAPEFLIRLQNRPELIRNICILAHVDHGKTSLSDNLLASNGIISQSQQGQIRYLDSRPDEQARGITMESSAISLYFKMLRKIEGQEAPQAKEYLINLIDSPGHIDFSSEVSTASRLCDGAVVVVDAVEGVCSQTVTVLRQAWNEKMKPILVINKFDRLITELQQTPMEAYQHLARLIEQVNAVVGMFYQGQRMEEDVKWRERLEQEQVKDHEFVESSDEDLYFAPEKNNVVFGSAVDGWGFNISQFAAIYERKLGMNRKKLEKVLWGEYYMDPKTKAVIAGSAKLKGRKIKPLFVQLVLDNIWAVYKSCVLERDPQMCEKIINSLGLRVQPRDIKAKDGRACLLAIFSQWIPLSRAILLSVVDIMPSPLEAQRDRIPMILGATPAHEKVDTKVSDAMKQCEKSGPVTAYISKVVAYPEKDIPKERRQVVDRIAEIRERSARARQLALGTTGEVPNDRYDDEEESLEGEMADLDVNVESEKIIGFGRVYSGTLKVGDQVSLLNPKYDPASPTDHFEHVTVGGLFLLMGRDMIPLDEAPAGSIVGIGGLDGKILKSGTLVSSQFGGPNLASTSNTAAPILRVAIEPVDPTKMDNVEQGLKLLNISDPCVQVSVLESGELILATAGELHLERCIKDLKERYAKVDIHCSEPIVPYRETIVDGDGGDYNEAEAEGPRGYVTVEAAAATVEVKLQIYPLSSEVVDYITSNADRIRGLAEKCGDMEMDQEEAALKIEHDITKLNELKTGLDKLLKQHKTDTIVSFGPRRVGPNILFDATNQITRRVFPQDEKNGADRSIFEESILSGFQLAVSKGLLCAEPLEGVGCVIEKITRIGESSDLESATSSASSRMFSLVRDGIWKGIGHWSPRLKLAKYMCDIQAPTEVLGKVYGVVTKRRGKIISEDMNESTQLFTIQASIPVADAFGFSAEIRKRTSGSANPQLVFSGFEMLDQDPYWVPTTEEELEELGELADRENIAMNYVKSIRKRKGMAIDQKLVERGERQRTMKK